MTTPRLSDPIPLTPTDLRTDQAVANQLTDFIVKTFRRTHVADPEKWDSTLPRLGSPAELLDMLGNDGLMVITYDLADDENVTATGRGKIVACAGVIPWTGTAVGFGELDKDEKAMNKGWEIKVVCVDGDAKYAKKGLAVKAVAYLEDYLIKQESKASQGLHTHEAVVKKDVHGTLALWIIAAECIAGVYWRKRGFTNVRKTTMGPGIWGSKTTFEMVFLRKDVEL